MPEKQGHAEEPIRIGVFICHCGGNISDVVHVEEVAAAVRAMEDVVVSTTHMFTCSDPGQALIEERIREDKLNRIIVAACSPTLHLETFRRAVTRAGLNPFLLEHVNIREQVSWVVEDRGLATEKAIRLVRAAIGRIRHLVPLDKRRIPIAPSALVIGGGIAGLVATRDLAERGMRVTLVENSPFLGGRVAQLETLFPSGERARELLGDIIRQVVDHPMVTIHTNASVIESDGIVGSFRARVRVEPRGANHMLHNAGTAIAACPEETISEFNYGLSSRKAIYMSYPGCWPSIPAIDWRTCTRCGKCLAAVGGKGIELDEPAREFDIHAGVIILATGYDPYEPYYGEYGYGVFPGVVSLQQFTRMLDEEGPSGGRIAVDGKPVRSVAFIHCTGARQYRDTHPHRADGGVNEYCARTCCTGALHAALQLKERHPDVQIYDVYQDIRTYGRGHEDFYDRASREGVLFMQMDGRKLPRILHDPEDPDRLMVRVQDKLTDNLELDVPVDMVVLATGVVPHDISELVDMFKCAIGYNSFLLEVHPKLRPVELAVSGVFLAGTCQGPMDVTEASAAAAAAAAKAASLIAQGTIEMDPFIAQVNEDLCTGCQTCLSVCPYEAIKRDPATELARINEALCTGCGTCVATCPSDAIYQYGFTDRQIRSELELLLADAGLSDDLERRTT